MAEWLGRGLQSLVQRFESARRLVTYRSIVEGDTPTYTPTEMGSATFVLPTVFAAILGFMLGWSIEFDRLMAEHRPDGCDGPCVFLASESHDDALLAGLVGALVLGLTVLGLVVLVLARRRSEPNPPASRS